MRRATEPAGRVGRDGPQPQRIRGFVMLTAVGLGLRFALLVLAGPSELLSDEGHYAYLAMSWLYFGILDDTQRFLWPPGYPFLLAVALDALGVDGLLAIKCLQVVASGSIGLSTMLLARRLFGEPAAWIAGAIWCVHLPLAGFTHLLWPETFFTALLTPALLLLLGVVQDDPGGSRSDRRVLATGLLLAAALYLKEVVFYLIPLLALLLLLRAGLRPASLLILSVVPAVLPWTIRNYEVYERVVPMGITLGENAYRGLNARYTNFDLAAFRSGGQRPTEWGRSCFVASEADSGWQRADEIRNTPDRLDENLRRGLAYAAARPGWFLCSRLKKLADFLTPLSFVVRHVALDRYEGLLGRPAPRRVAVAWALTCSVGVLALAVYGYFRAPAPGVGRRLVSVVVAYFVATSLVVSMSRFRIPIEPLLIALAAGGVVAGTRGTVPRPGARLGLAVGASVLAFAWWLNFGEVAFVAQRAWR